MIKRVFDDDDRGVESAPRDLLLALFVSIITPDSGRCERTMSEKGQKCTLSLEQLVRS